MLNQHLLRYNTTNEETRFTLRTVVLLLVHLPCLFTARVEAATHNHKSSPSVTAPSEGRSAVLQKELDGTPTIRNNFKFTNCFCTLTSDIDRCDTPWPLIWRRNTGCIIVAPNTPVLVDKKNQIDVTFCIFYFFSNSFSTCFGQPCAHHQELTTAWCYSLVLVCAVAAGRWSRPVGR